MFLAMLEKGALDMSDMIDIHDLSQEQKNLIHDFVDFLRRKCRSYSIREERHREKEWSSAAISSFAKDWDNEKDAVYDNWREHYHVPER
jgi:hypothetical protein